MKNMTTNFITYRESNSTLLPDNLLKAILMAAPNRPIKNEIIKAFSITILMILKSLCVKRRLCRTVP